MKWFRRSRKRFKKDRLTAAFLNDTADIYHWGCYATSNAIASVLEGAGYDLRRVDCFQFHYHSGEAPLEASDKAISDYFLNLKKTNRKLHDAVSEADIVVINGEGTLHRFGQGQKSLLSILRMAHLLDKPSYLINHGCFPSGTRDKATDQVETYYRHCVSDVTEIVVRDPWSAEAYARWGIPVKVGFDCLPLFSRTIELPTVPKRIVIGSGSHWQHEDAKRIGLHLKKFLPQRETIFLSGGIRPPAEDSMQFAGLKEALPDAQFINAASVGEWLSLLKNAELVVTGRFHHLIAAATYSTPIVSLPGNTPKIDATCDYLGLPPPISHMATQLEHELAQRIAAPARLPPESAAKLVDLAEINFDFLSKIGRGMRATLETR